MSEQLSMTNSSVSGAAEMLANRRAQASEEQPQVSETEAPEEEVTEEESGDELESAENNLEETDIDTDSEEHLDVEEEEISHETMLVRGEEMTIDEVESVIDDLEKGNMLNKDYTQKTQKLAAEQKRAENMQQMFVAKIGKEQTNLQHQLGEFQNVDWLRMSRENPEAYQTMQVRKDGIEQQLNTIQTETQQFFQQIDEHQKAVQQQAAQECVNALQQYDPEWGKDRYDNLITFAEAQGFDKASVLNYTDPNIFKMLDMAQKYQSAQSIGTTKRVKSTATTPLKKSVKSSRTSVAQMNAGKAFKKAQKSGSVGDAVAAMKARRLANRK